MLELAPRLLEELVKVLDLISFSELWPFNCGVVHVCLRTLSRLSNGDQAVNIYIKHKHISTVLFVLCYLAVSNT
jgi:hypothetical protein